MTPMLIVITNVPDMAAGKTIARELVELRLAACVNILPAVESVYRWQGVVEEANEATLLIKTRQEHFADLQAAIRAAHPYEVPEIVAMPIVAGLPEYIDWMVRETTKDVNA